MLPSLRRHWPSLLRARDVDRLFDSFFGDFPTLGRGGELIPPLDVIEKNKEIVVRAELPGVEEKDIDIRLENNVLTVRGEKRQEAQQEGDNYHLVETRWGSFARSLSLPADVDPGKVDAEFSKGVLTITLPKTEQAKSRKISIKAK